ncbi:MAG: hypothetical protein MUE67_07145 [Anaerolineales bacterium]|jgi:hypothetical protein|nr:hypothetical protein [Anaerolineales bacterium]
MGLDFSYRLFFPSASRFEVLERLAEMAEPDLEKGAWLVFPDRVLSLPFEAWLDTGPRIEWDDPNPKWDFMTVLRFDLDPEIIAYLERQRHPQTMEKLRAALDAPPGSDQKVGIGYIYLTVDRKPDAGDGLVLFQFDTPGTTMSILFVESQSIRQAFIRLLESCQGVYGILDMEDSAELFWWKGQEMSVRLPHAYLTSAEIEEFLENGGENG